MTLLRYALGLCITAALLVWPMGIPAIRLPVVSLLKAQAKVSVRRPTRWEAQLTRVWLFRSLIRAKKPQAQQVR